MEAQALTATQVMLRHGGELERMGHVLEAGGRSKRVTLTGISVSHDGANAETLVLRMADAADVVPFAKRLQELSDPVANQWPTPFHKALRGLPLKFTFPAARI